MVEPILELTNISKSFPGVRALDKVSFSLLPGEIHALLGENGAGKSTLIKVISGAYNEDSGDIYWMGKKVSIKSPVHALHLGVGCIYQEFNLVPDLTVAENILLGQIPRTRWGSIDSKELHRRAQEALAMFDFHLDTHLTIRELNVAQQQIVEICKALARDLKVLIMDEPTAALNSVETEHLYRVIRQLKDHGVSIIYISHRMREIFDLADRVTVLKDGQLVGTRVVAEVDDETLVRMMVGRVLENLYPEKNTATARTVLRVENLCFEGAICDINFEIRAGEVLGVAGLEGMGQRELSRMISGSIRATSGKIYLEDKELVINHPADAIRAGISYIPDDRKNEGLVLVRSVRENITLPSLDRRMDGIVINERSEKNFVNQMVDSLAIRVSTPAQMVRNLSGGNQQKVVVAKCIGAQPKVLILAEPTRGIDVGSKSEIHHLIRRLAAQGLAVLMISSELPEILGMSDRILVMAHGKIVAEMPGTNVTEEDIMFAATSVDITNGKNGNGDGSLQ